MKLIIIFGPPASGKMTVGQELQKLTGLKLFYNHMSLELVNQFFDFGTPPFKKLDTMIRFGIFEEIANSDIEGLIFTVVWAFNEKEDEEYINHIIDIFQKRNPQVCLVELQTDLEERLKRNKEPHRLKYKPSKRNVEFSEKLLLSANKEHRMNSFDNEFPEKNIFKIKNTHISAQEAAQLIQAHFDL